MIWTLFVPTAVVLGATAVVPLGAARLRPAAAAWALTAVLVGSVVALAAASLAVLLGSASHWGVVARGAGWCVSHLSHPGMPAVVGPLVGAGVVAAVANVSLVARRQHHAAAPLGEDPVVVLPAPEAVAYALPGQPGQVVVSTGMLRALEPDERRVLFAHERAHLRLHHHRFLHLGELSVAALPLLRPVRSRLAHAVERWADEHAAHEVGDRQLVARTIAKAALATGGRALPHPEALGADGGQVSQRVAALLTDGTTGGSRPAVGVVAAGGALAVVGATAQLHHLATYALGLC